MFGSPLVWRGSLSFLATAAEKSMYSIVFAVVGFEMSKMQHVYLNLCCRCICSCVCQT